MTTPKVTGRRTTEALRAVALEIFRAGLAAASPTEAVRRYLSLDTMPAGLLRRPRLTSFRSVYLVGAGKAAGAMAAAVVELLGDRIDDGCIVVPPCAAISPRVRIVHGSHPLPDEEAMRGAAEIVSLAEGADERDLVIVVLSGGGSALLPLPVRGVSLEDLRQTTDALLRAGADIFELNAVRKHLSRIQGGRLARAATPAMIVTLVLSDVVGNRLDVVASGPTVPDTTTFTDAWAVLLKHGLVESAGTDRVSQVAGCPMVPLTLDVIDPPGPRTTRPSVFRGIPTSVLAHLQSGLRGEVPETPKPGDPAFERTHTCVVADNQTALGAMRSHAQALGFLVEMWGGPLIGEAREGGKRIGRELVRLSGGKPGAAGSNSAAGVDSALEASSTFGADPAVGAAPAGGSASSLECASATGGICLLFGGETTVIVRGTGHGGRSQELAVAAAIELAGARDPAGVVLLAAGSDGIDGNSDAAGGLVDGTTLARAGSMGLDPNEALGRNDCTAFLGSLGDLVVTGPTGTNVGDVGIGLLGVAL